MKGITGKDDVIL